MAEIFYDQIASTKEFEDQLQSLMKVIVGLKNEMKESAKEMLSEMRNLSEQGMGELTKKASALGSAYNKLAEEEKKLEKETREIAKAQESLSRQRQQGLAMMAKEENRMREATRLSKINATNLEELKQKASALRTLLDKSDFGSKRFKELQNELNKTNTDLKKFDATVNQHQRNVGNYSSIWQSAKNIMVKTTAVVGSLWGAISVGESIIKSSQATSDEWEKTITGLKFGLKELYKTIATGDFSNFLENIWNAIKAGREYADVLDDLADRNRALSIREAEVRIEIERLEQTTKNKMLSRKERLDAAKKANELELALAKDRQENANRLFEAEKNNLIALSGLTETQLLNFVKLYDRTEDLREQAIKYNETVKAMQQSQLDTYANAKAGITAVAGSYDLVATSTVNASEEVKVYAKILEKVGKTSDEELDQLVKAWVETYNVQSNVLQATEKGISRISTLEKQIQEETAKVDKGAVKSIEEISAEMGKIYDELYKERIKNEESAYKISKDIGIATTQEVFNYELKKILESAEYRLLIEGKTAEEIMAIRKAASDRAAEETRKYTSEKTSKYTVAGLPTGVDEKMPEFGASLDDMTTSLEEWFADNEDLLDEINMWAQMFGNAMIEVFGMITEANRREMEIQMQDIERRYQFEQDALQRAYDNNLISKSEYDKKSNTLDKKRAAEQEKLRRENAKKQQTIAILQAIVNTALGVTSALSSGFTIAEKIVGALLIAALGIAEIATISSVKYAKGGHFKVGKEGKVLKGKSHAEGGVRLSDIEAEGGEYVGVINKQSTRKYGDFLPLVMDSLNRGNFENVFSPNLMVIPETRIQKKMLDVMTKPKIEKHTYVAGNRVITKIGNQTIITHLR